MEHMSNHITLKMRSIHLHMHKIIMISLTQGNIYHFPFVSYIDHCIDQISHDAGYLRTVRIQRQMRILNQTDLHCFILCHIVALINHLFHHTIHKHFLRCPFRILKIKTCNIKKLIHHIFQKQTLI